MLCQSRNIFSPFHFLIYVAKEVASSEASLMQYVCIELKENLSKKKKASLCAPGKGARRLRLAAVAVCSGGGAPAAVTSLRNFCADNLASWGENIFVKLISPLAHCAALVRKENELG